MMSGPTNGLRQVIVATDVNGSQAIYADGAKVYEGDLACALDIGNAAGAGSNGSAGTGGDD